MRYTYGRNGLVLCEDCGKEMYRVEAMEHKCGKAHIFNTTEGTGALSSKVMRYVAGINIQDGIISCTCSECRKEMGIDAFLAHGCMNKPQEKPMEKTMELRIKGQEVKRDDVREFELTKIGGVVYVTCNGRFLHGFRPDGGSEILLSGLEQCGFKHPETK